MKRAERRSRLKKFIWRKIYKIRDWFRDRKKARERRKLLIDIYRTTGVYLDAWQSKYVFDYGEYQSEARYGTKNGKTTANIFRMLFMSRTFFFIDGHSYLIRVGSHWASDTAWYMKEDAATYERRAEFIRLFQEYYHELKKSKRLQKLLCRYEVGTIGCPAVHDLEDAVIKEYFEEL